ncbi:MAG: hypothetical protein JST58_16830 [Bacteroidetes bacterium]|nr:hypothetical protein [Bacteroidota bacterium]
MEKSKSLFLFLIALFTIAMMSCSSGNKIGGSSKNCGCGLNKGMVGYGK